MKQNSIINIMNLGFNDQRNLSANSKVIKYENTSPVNQFSFRTFITVPFSRKEGKMDRLIILGHARHGIDYTSQCSFDRTPVFNSKTGKLTVSQVNLAEETHSLALKVYENLKYKRQKALEKGARLYNYEEASNE